MGLILIVLFIVMIVYTTIILCQFGLNSEKIILNISLILLLIMIIILFVRKLVNPYISIFESIKNVMQKANNGDYSGRIDSFNNDGSKEVSHWINEHMDKIQTNLLSIEDKIDIFLTINKDDNIQDPIINVEHKITRLADIYKFRKTIEHDEKISEVYKRLAVILEEKFNICDFNFIEADTINKTTKIVYINKEILCDPISDGCRSDRTNALVDSSQFKILCDKFNNDDKTYFCVSYPISNDMDFIISLVSNNQKEHEKVRILLPLIQDYVDVAKPEIVSKKLMQVFERNAQIDPLTGLYNRKFLEKYIDNSLYKGIYNNIPCGIMMVDIDLFKLINDNYGYDIGDIVIKTIANTLLDVVTSNDIVVRFGGEEFIVIVINCTEKRLASMAENIRIAFSQQKIQENNEEFNKTISIGTALFPNKDKNFWKYVKQSNIALYSAKQTGRNKIIRYIDGME
jgi:diguanylate cyclase (GGDEF)-like protein